MENIETNTITDYASERLAPASPAAASRSRSGKPSNGAQEKAAGNSPAPMSDDYAIELALLQAEYDRCLQNGLEARTTAIQDEVGTPGIAIYLFGVQACADCDTWHVLGACPTCENQKG